MGWLNNWYNIFILNESKNTIFHAVVYPSLSEKHSLALLDLLLDASQDGRELQASDIREEVDTFTFAVSINYHILGLKMK
jgi:hypothetical protein